MKINDFYNRRIRQDFRAVAWWHGENRETGNPASRARSVPATRYVKQGFRISHFYRATMSPVHNRRMK
jgi:hypothetical protein